MNEVFYTVQVGNCDRKFREGTTYLDIAKEYQHEYEHDIVLVFVDGRLQELFKTLKKDCKLEFVTTADSLGYKAYRRSMSLMLVKAVYDVAEHKNIDKVRIHYSVSKGYYCTIEGNIELTQEFLDKVERRMRTMVEKNLPIQKKSVHTDDAIAMFGEHGMHDKERLFHYRRVSRVNIYSMNEFEDYYYGYMVPSAGYLKYFKLYLYDEGFVIQMPTQGEPEKVPPFEPQNQLFHVLQESTKWGDAQGIETVGDLNDKITRSDVNELVLVQEALQEEKIAQIAEQVRVRSDVRFVLIAGPSSSGKTTFAKRLCVQLMVNGLQPLYMGLDDYYKERCDSPVDEDGNYNFENLEALDIDLFNDNMNRLLAGEAVDLPEFDFTKGQKVFGKRITTLQPDQPIIIEGIHGLNERLTERIDESQKFRIYISPFTQLNIDRHNRVTTTDARMIRRIVRDYEFRGSSAAETIALWPKVRAGEDRNIFPYNDRADVMFNSALTYELSVLRKYAEPILEEVDEHSSEYAEAVRLLKFIRFFDSIENDKVIPNNSIIREFIGGSVFVE